jgi:hypothetical protein
VKDFTFYKKKIIFWVSKLTGVFPVSFSKDPLTAYETVDITVSASITGVIYSITMFCVIMGGILSAIIWAHFDFSDLGMFVVDTLSTSAVQAMALVSVIMNATVNRRKMSNLIIKLL